MSKLIDNYIYFYHFDRFCVIPLYPDSITDSQSVQFNQTPALSRSAPVMTYSNSGPRSVSINLTLHRDLMNDVNKNVSNLKDSVIDFSADDYVDTLIKYLQASAMPKYKIYSVNSKSVIPPMVAIRFGNEIFIKGVVTSGIQCTYAKPINTENKYMKCDISFTVVEVDPYDADIVSQQGSFRGVSRTFKDGIYNSTTAAQTNMTGGVSGLRIDSRQQSKTDVSTFKATSTVEHLGGQRKFPSLNSTSGVSAFKSSSGNVHVGGQNKF